VFVRVPLTKSIQEQKTKKFTFSVFWVVYGLILIKPKVTSFSRDEDWRISHPKPSFPENVTLRLPLKTANLEATFSEKEGLRGIPHEQHSITKKRRNLLFLFSGGIWTDLTQDS
jgi:hypothetical protein